MIEPKEIPKEFVSIRQVWLMQINRCLEAMTNRELKDDKAHGLPGHAAIIDGVNALYYTLIDYGEAKIKSDVDRVYGEWRDKKFKENPGKKFPAYTFHQKQFQIIIQVLNKYGMLFESQPKGYNNVEMKSIYTK